MAPNFGSARVSQRRVSLRLTVALCLAPIPGALACRDVTVPNYSSASVEQLTVSPTKSAVQAALVGMLAAFRFSAGPEGRQMCTLGKECYNLLTNDGRSIQWITGPIEPGGFIGSLQDMGWAISYRNVRQAAVVLDATDKVAEFTVPQREGIRGFVKTVAAIELFHQLRIRDVSGIAVDLSADQSAPPPIVSKDEALARIAALLDEARTHLLAAGATFEFPLHGGFSSFGAFSSPAGFLQVNRGVKARVEIHRSQWASALAALNESFIDVSSGSATTLAKGVYHVYSTAAGDATNQMFDATPSALFVHPSILSGAQTRANGQPDLRLTQKTAPGVPSTIFGVLGTHKFTIYASRTAPSPVLRNEELILLRAEARYHSGDNAGALQDLNFIRVNSGGLPPLAGFASQSAFVDELLYNRTYSLLLERGHRWVDARRYGRLAQLPKINTHINEKTFPYVMLPQVECDQHSPPPQPGCSQVPAI